MSSDFVRLVTERRGDAQNCPAFLRHARTDAGPFCPFIEKAIERNLLFASPFTLQELRDFSFAGDAAESLFFIGLAHTEQLRSERAKLDQPGKIVICDNIVILEPTNLDSVSLRQLIGWPHWMLKCLYSRKKLMFGKFWRDEELTTQRGKSLAPPPLTFISIRSAVLDRDLAFVKNSEAVSKMLADALDDMSSPLPGGADVSSLLDSTGEERTYQYHILKAWAEGLRETIQ